MLWLSSSGLTKWEMPASLSFIICFLSQLSHHHPCRAQAQQRHRAEHLQVLQAGCASSLPKPGQDLTYLSQEHLPPPQPASPLVLHGPAEHPSPTHLPALAQQCWEDLSPLGIANDRENPTQHMCSVHLLHTEITFLTSFATCDGIAVSHTLPLMALPFSSCCFAHSPKLSTFPRGSQGCLPMAPVHRCPCG